MKIPFTVKIVKRAISKIQYTFKKYICLHVYSPASKSKVTAHDKRKCDKKTNITNLLVIKHILRFHWDRIVHRNSYVAFTISMVLTGFSQIKSNTFEELSRTTYKFFQGPFFPNS